MTYLFSTQTQAEKEKLRRDSFTLEQKELEREKRRIRADRKRKEKSICSVVAHEKEIQEIQEKSDYVLFVNVKLDKKQNSNNFYTGTKYIFVNVAIGNNKGTKMVQKPIQLKNGDSNKKILKELSSIGITSNNEKRSLYQLIRKHLNDINFNSFQYAIVQNGEEFEIFVSNVDYSHGKGSGIVTGTVCRIYSKKAIKNTKVLLESITVSNGTELYREHTFQTVNKVQMKPFSHRFNFDNTKTKLDFTLLAGAVHDNSEISCDKHETEFQETDFMNESKADTRIQELLERIEQLEKSRAMYKELYESNGKPIQS